MFFRDQNIDHAAQVEFTSRFGEVTFAHPLGEPEPVSGFPQIKPVDRKLYEQQYGFRTGGPWHTDVTAAINPPAASILRAVNVPNFGGDTQWSNLVAAYEGLSAPLHQSNKPLWQCMWFDDVEDLAANTPSNFLPPIHQN